MTYQREGCHPLRPAVTFVKHLSECRIWPRAARQQEKPWWGWMRSQDTCHPAVSHVDLAETTADFSLGLQEQLCTEVKSQVSSCCLQNRAVTRSWEPGAPRSEAGAAPGHASMCRLQAAASRTALPFFSTNKMKKLQISYALRLFFFFPKKDKSLGKSNPGVYFFSSGGVGCSLNTPVAQIVLVWFISINLTLTSFILCG